MKKVVSWFLTVAMLLSLVVTTSPMARAAEVTQRYIYDAEVLPDGSIGVLFIYGGTSSSGIVTGGTLYCGVYDPDTQSWTQQAVMPGGGASVAAKDAAMALDEDGNPHVVYVFTGGDSYDDIGYTYLSEASWAEALSFSSNNDGDRTDGTLSSPEIAVDSSGAVHIAYIDSQGNNADSSYSRHPDLMYRTIDGESIGVSETIVHSFCENAGGSTFYQNNIVSSPAIAHVGNTAYIGCASKGRYGGASDWNGVYTIFPRPSGSSASFGLYYGSSSASERGFMQFAMAADGTGIYSLYYVSGTTTDGIPAGLHIANGISTPTLFSSPGTSILTGDITTNGASVYAAGINNVTLTLFQNAAPTTKTLTAGLLSTHPRMATVVTGGSQYILYTGNDAEKSLFIASVPTGGGDLDEYQVPNKTAVTISGVTVADKEYDGSPVNPGGMLTVTGAALTSEDLVYTYTSTDGGGYNSINPPSDAGAYKLVISVPEDNANYSGSSADINFSITKKPVTVTGTTTVSRSYVPGNTAVSLDTTGSALNGVILTDEPAVVLDKNSAAGSVATADAGTGKTVTVTGFAISGSKADNYTLSQPEGLTIGIAPFVLTAPMVSLTADNTGGGLSATVSDAANTLGVGSYEVEIYEEGILKKTVAVLTKDSVNNIPLEEGVIVPENAYTAKAKAVADLSGNYADSVPGVSSSSAVASYAPLSFADNAAYDIPSSNVDVPIAPIDVSGGITGGKAPHVFSASGLPAWAQISNSGVISGTPQAASSGGSATVTVTDAQSSTQSITIAYGAVNKGDALEFGGVEPPADKTYGDEPFDLALTYDGEASNVSYYVVSGPGTLSGSKLTITGAGSIVVRATGTSDNYATKAQDYTVNVAKKAVTITPAAESNTKVYGQADPALVYTYSPLVDTDTLSGTVLTRSAGENAGSYAITIAASAEVNNSNYTLTLAPGSHYFSITKKPLTISGAVISPKAYDGTTSIDLSDVTSVTLNGDLDSMALGTDFEVNAASYTDNIYVGTGKSTSITIALKPTVNGNNYMFETGADTYTGATAGITPAVQNISAENQTLTVTQTLDLCSVALSNASGAVLTFAIDGGTSDYATLSGSVLTATAPGTVTININSQTVNMGGTADSEYGAAAQKQITVTVSAKENGSDTIAFIDSGITYGQSYTPDPTTTLTGGLWSYSYSGTVADGTPYASISAPIKAGNYTVTATYENATHIGTKAANLTISPKLLTITGVTAADRTYNGTLTVVINGGTLAGVESGDTVSAGVPGTGTIATADAGTDKAVLLGEITLTGADKDNYTLSQPVGITVNIVPKVMTFTIDSIAAQEYTGSQTAPVPTVKDGIATLAANTDYMVSYGTNISAGTDSGSISITGIGNYLGSSANVTFTISKADYSGPPVTGAKQVLSQTTVSGITFDLSSLSFPSGFTNKSFVSASVGSDPDGLLSGVTVLDTTLSFNMVNKPAGTWAVIYVTVSSDNYNDYIAEITVTTVDKTPVSVVGVTVADKTYDALPAAPGGAPANADGYTGPYEYRYEGTSTTVYNDTLAPTNAGTYRLIVRIPLDDTAYTGEQVINFTISKAMLTVKPQDLNIYTGDPIPSPNVTYTGLKGNDTWGSVAVLSAGNLNMEIKGADGIAPLISSAATGSYTIKLTGAPQFHDSDNYNITLDDGILTISNRPATGGGTPSSPSYNAEVSGGSNLPVNVNTTVNSASVNLESIAGNLTTEGNTAVTLPSIPGVSIYTAILPDSSLSGSMTGSLTINTDAGSITIPGNMLSDTGLTGNAEITIGAGNISDLPDDVRNKIGDRPIIRLTLAMDGQQAKWSNPNAPVTVSIPFTPTAEELGNPGNIVVWYIDGSGNVITIPNGRYNAATGMVTFSTTHFSNYAVAFNNVVFSDVSNTAWYSNAVSFIAAREITTGTDNGKYSPEAKLTRGEFIVLMMRAYGIAPDTNPSGNFADAGDTYYTGYLAAAKRLGITSGTGNNMYAPDKKITRQEMFTLLYNALNVIGQSPEEDSGRTLSDFTDAGQIDAWAMEAMTLLVETGTVSGSGDKLNPAGTTTRAEMAQVLYNLLGK